MSATRLLVDANLSDIVLRNGTTGIEFLFLDMSDGGQIDTLHCTGVMLFTYHVELEDGLPHYVGEVDHSVLSRAEARTLLDRLEYNFNRDAVVEPNMGSLHYIEMEGWVSIKVLCRSVEFNRAGSHTS